MTDTNPEEIRDFVPDRPLATPLVKEIMRVLGQHEEAAYRVYLLLAEKYGVGRELS